MAEMGPALRTAEWAGGLIFSLPLHPFVIIQVWLSTSHSLNETCVRQPLPPTQISSDKIGEFKNKEKNPTSFQKGFYI